MQQEDKIVDFDVGEFICFLIVVLSAEGLSFGLVDGKLFTRRFSFGNLPVFDRCHEHDIGRFWMSLIYKNLSVINPFLEICISLKLTINFSEKVIHSLWLELIQVKVLSQKQKPKQNLFKLPISATETI